MEKYILLLLVLCSYSSFAQIQVDSLIAKQKIKLNGYYIKGVSNDPDVNHKDSSKVMTEAATKNMIASHLVSEGQITADGGFYSENNGLTVGGDIYLLGGASIHGEIWEVNSDGLGTLPGGVGGFTGLTNWNEEYVISNYHLGADGVNFTSNAWDGYHLYSKIDYTGLYWEDNRNSTDNTDNGSISLSSTHLNLNSNTNYTNNQTGGSYFNYSGVGGSHSNSMDVTNESWNVSPNTVGGSINNGSTESSYSIGIGGININDGIKDVFTVYGTGDAKMTSVGFWDNPNGDFLGEVSYDDGRFIFYDANDDVHINLDCTVGNSYIATIENNRSLMGNFKVLAPISMSTTEINSFPYPNDGNIVYNSTLHTICFYNGTSWQKVSSTNMN